MRTLFDESLVEIHGELSEMGRTVNTAIGKSVEALVRHDVAIATEVIENDLVINKKQNEIDQKCYEIIALQQPNTSDLRRILAVMRAASELERMGDHATNIADVTINVKGTKRDQELEEQISKMGEKLSSMSHDIIEAFVSFDVEQAVATAKEDQKIDDMYRELRSTAVSLMQKDPKYVFAAADYSFVGMHLERIGDYIKNIAEWIVYLDTGEITELG